MFAPVQSDGRSRGDLHNRAGGVDAPGAWTGLPRGCRLLGTDGGGGGGAGGAGVSRATRKGKGEAARVERQPKKGLKLFLEMGCEEIPAGMVTKAAGDLKAYLEKLLTAES